MTEKKIKNINLLLTEREGRTGEYWPEVVAVRTERSEVGTKTAEGQYSPVRLEQARLVSSLLYGTRVILVSKLPAFENKKYTSYDHFHGNGPYGKIPTKKEPIRTPGFTPRLPCHIINININIFEIYFLFIFLFYLFIYLFIFIIIFRYAIAYLRTGSYAPAFLWYKSMPFVISGRDHLRSNMDQYGDHFGPGSFVVQFGDHLRSWDHLRTRTGMQGFDKCPFVWSRLSLPCSLCFWCRQKPAPPSGLLSGSPSGPLNFLGGNKKKIIN